MWGNRDTTGASRARAKPGTAGCIYDHVSFSSTQTMLIRRPGLASSSHPQVGTFRVASDREVQQLTLDVARWSPSKAGHEARCAAGRHCLVRPGRGRRASAGTRSAAREPQRPLLSPEPKLTSSLRWLRFLLRAVPQTACKSVRRAPAERGQRPTRGYATRLL